MNKGAVICIVDGMSDESFTFADYSHLHSMTQTGAHGFFNTVPPGFEVESYPCIASLLGVAVEELPTQARGYLEAVGAGLTLAENDLILRASWLRVTAGDIVGGPVDAPLEPPVLPPGCEYYGLGSYKALLILRGCAHLLPCVKTCAPPACAGHKLAEILPQGEPRLVELVRLSQGQGRVLLPWGQSAPCRLPAIGYRTAALGAALIFAGLARSLGMNFFTQPGFTADIDTDLYAKARLAEALTQQYRLVALHINGADEAAHRCDMAQKQSFLRRMDDAVLRPLLDAGIPLLVCADHGTSPLNGLHIGGGQPFVLVGTKRRGNLGLLPATTALKLLLGE